MHGESALAGKKDPMFACYRSQSAPAGRLLCLDFTNGLWFVEASGLVEIGSSPPALAACLYKNRLGWSLLRKQAELVVPKRP